jgi:hypothetical protein
VVIDENAFGWLIAWATVEDEEYGLEREPFVERLRAFRACLAELLAHEPPGAPLNVLDAGATLYCELAQGDETADPFGWLKAARARLSEAGFESIGVLSHGSRWVPEDDEAPLMQLDLGERARTCHWAWSSEPWRRASAAEGAARGDEEHPGWGAGLYLDAEALEALGKKLKNAPTPLCAGGGTFYRIGG